MRFVREATELASVDDLFSTEISIHAPREGGDGLSSGVLGSKEAISIHAPREGGDVRQSERPYLLHAISIHAPREGGDRWG